MHNQASMEMSKGKRLSNMEYRNWNKSVNKEINPINFVKELDTIQTRYVKEGVVGLAQRYLKKYKG